MIYAKIYLDLQEDGREAFVFEATPKSDLAYCNVNDFFVTVFGVEGVAISLEARDLLLARFRDKTSYTPKRFWGDVGISKDHFSFKHCEKNGGCPRLVLPTDAHFTVCVDRGISPEGFSYMTIADNGYLKALSLETPMERRVLLDRYYGEKRERGEELGCDVETIRQTPLDFMTQEQKAVIKKDYKTDCDGFDDNDWHYHGDFIYDKIITGLAEKYRKTFVEIKSIIG